jgi:hypothetical protein
MEQLYTMLGGWTWWIVALVMFVLELIAPGVFFLWLGFSAVVVGTIELFIDMSWQAEVGLFAVLSVISLILSRRFLSGRRTETDKPNLNKRMHTYVGQNFVLEQPIVNGRGELKIDDTIWKIRGPDSGAGSWVRLADVDGLVFVVEPAAGPGG